MDEIYLGYDAVQLLPVEPTTVYETGHAFWNEHPSDDDGVDIELTAPRYNQLGLRRGDRRHGDR